MNVSTMTVSEETAVQRIDDIKALKPSQRTDEDDALLALFTAVRKHKSRVIDIGQAFRQTGLNHLAQPKLAIARADWQNVRYTTRQLEWIDGKSWYRSGSFAEAGTGTHRAQTIHLPDNTFNRYRTGDLRSPVPHIPANVRPKFKLSNYHILFEVEKWETYPVDPFLLKRIHGNIYLVLAEWDLTELEASLLSGMRGL